MGKCIASLSLTTAIFLSTLFTCDRCCKRISLSNTSSVVETEASFGVSSCLPALATTFVDDFFGGLTSRFVGGIGAGIIVSSAASTLLSSLLVRACFSGGESLSIPLSSTGGAVLLRTGTLLLTSSPTTSFEDDGIFNALPRFF